MGALMTIGLVVANEIGSGEVVDDGSELWPVWVYPTIAAVLLILMLALTWAFRSVHKRH